MRAKDSEILYNFAIPTPIQVLKMQHIKEMGCFKCSIGTSISMPFNNYLHMVETLVVCTHNRF